MVHVCAMIANIYQVTELFVCRVTPPAQVAESQVSIIVCPASHRESSLLSQAQEPAPVQAEGFTILQQAV